MVALLAIVVGCSQRKGEVPADDHMATCEAACATVHACASDPDDPSEAACVANCAAPGEGVWQSQTCDALAEDMLRCIASMTCEEYAVYESDLASSACHEATLEYSMCLSEQSE